MRLRFTGITLIAGVAFASAAVRAMTVRDPGSCARDSKLIGQVSVWELKAHPDPRLEYVPRAVQRELDPKNDPRYSTWTEVEWGYVARGLARDAHLAAELKHAGMRMLAGTDAVTDYCVPGFALHDELRALVAAGFSPLEALQAATLEPAAFLGRSRDAGTVEAGKLADLVLVGDNPIADIRHAGAIRAIVRRGRYVDRGQLDAMLAGAKTAANPARGSGRD